MHKRGSVRGFSMMELMMATIILMEISGTTLSILGNYQKQYTSTVLKADMHGGLRSTIELLEQEIGQAGLVSLAQTTLSANVATGTQTVAVGSVTGMFVGEKLQIDLGSAQETVAITSINTSSKTIGGVFQSSHSSGAIVKAIRIFPQGILSATSDANHLNIFGDINGDGTTVYVQYVCDTTTTHTLTRSVTPITANAKNSAVVLIDNLMANPAPAGGTAPPCFKYP